MGTAVPAGDDGARRRAACRDGASQDPRYRWTARRCCRARSEAAGASPAFDGSDLRCRCGCRTGPRGSLRTNPTFAAKLLSAARKAWVAACQSGPVCAEIGRDSGGGDYDDDDFPTNLLGRGGTVPDNRRRQVSRCAACFSALVRRCSRRAVPSTGAMLPVSPGCNWRFTVTRCPRPISTGCEARFCGGTDIPGTAGGGAVRANLPPGEQPL